MSRYAGDAGLLLMYIVSGKHICYVMTFFRVGITASKMEYLSEANLSAG